MFKLYLIIHFSTNKPKRRRIITREVIIVSLIDHEHAHFTRWARRKEKMKKHAKWMRSLCVCVSIVFFFTFEFGYSNFSTDSDRSELFFFSYFASDFVLVEAFFLYSKKISIDVSQNSVIYIYIDHYFILAVEKSVKLYVYN